MRRVIIDTDTASDDAVALIMALKSDLHIEAITTVAGNVSLAQATKNALMTIEVVNQQCPEVYKGAAKPLFRELIMTSHVHGKDGMSDCDLINPTLKASSVHAADKIIELVSNYPNEIEIITIGPVTNIALAILKEPEIMKLVKHIYAMGSGGFGLGNITPVAEFNVYIDAEAFDVMLRFGIPLTIVGFDVCLSDTAFNRKDVDLLQSSKIKEAVFAAKANEKGFNHNKRVYNEEISDIPDAVALGVVLWPEIVLEDRHCYCYVSINQDPTYGLVIVDDGGFRDMTELYKLNKKNAVVCKKIDNKLFKENLMALLMKGKGDGNKRNI